MPFGLPSIEQGVIIIMTVALVGSGVAYHVEKNWRKDAEKALVDYKAKNLEEANQAWERVNKARNEFDEAVRDGLGKLRVMQDTIAQGSEEYRRLVDADPGGKVLLTPAELAALRVLAARHADQQAGGGSIRPANSSP